MKIFWVTFSASDLWLLGICGALFLVLINLRYTSEIRKRDNFNKAAQDLIDTFHRVMKGVYPIPTNWPDSIDHYLRARFDSLSESVGKFKRHLPRRKQKAFDEAWFRFYCATGREVDRNCQCYHHYMPYSGVSVIEGKEIFHDTTQTYRDEFKKNIDALLEFTKQR